MKILVSGGGTGGHIIPTLAVIEELKKLRKDIEFLYVGSKSGMEKDLVPEKGIKFKGIYCGKLRRYFSWENFTDLFRVLIGFSQSLNIVKSFKPAAIFVKGGYVTVPSGLAGGIMGIPLIAHESDTVLGLSNRLLLKKVHTLCMGFPLENYPEALRSKGIYTGNPINPEIMKSAGLNKEEGVTHFNLNKEYPSILITGGSQGANALNKVVSEILEELLKNYNIIHLSGKPDYPWLKDLMGKLSPEYQTRYKLFDYLSSDMARALIVSDLVITRGGANTLAEITVLKKPGIIIPLPKAANDHQKKNALVLAKHGSAIILEQSELKSETLLNEISKLFSNKETLLNMSEKASSLARPDAALSIAKTILEVAERKGK